MKNLKKFKTLFILIVMGYSVSSFGQILEAWELSSQAGNQLSSTSTTSDINIGMGTLSRGAGLTVAAAGGSISSSGWFSSATPTTLLDAIANNDYYEFTLPINVGYQANISSVGVVVRSSNTGPNTATLRSSADGFTSNLGTIAITAASVLNSIPVTITNQTGILTFRLYAYGNAVNGTAGSGGTMRIGSTVVASDNDLIISGTTSASALCNILSADFQNVGTCNDNGTPSNSADDYYVADVSVTFANPPVTGLLQFEAGNDALPGGGALSVSTAGLTSPYTFTGVRFKADNTPTVVEIEFSELPTTCVLTKVGPTVASCSAGVCNVSQVTLVNMGSCNNNGTPLNGSDDYFTADVTIEYSVKPGTGTLFLSGDIIGGVTSINVNDIGVSTFTFTNVRFSADSGPITVSASFSDVMGCSFTNNSAGTAPGPCTFIAPCTFPYFSEYIEGSSFNKCLEIYNPTASPIDLAAEGYKIEMYFNGNVASTLFLNLTGIILPGDVFVVCNSSATADFTSLADQIGTGGWFNGDDAVVLRNTSGIVDVIGQIGVDPGTNWSNSGIETSEQTLRRYSFIQKGDNNGSDAFNPSSEWESYPQNTLWGLGYHATACQPSLPYGWNPISIGCNSGTSAYNDNTNTWTQTSNCFNPNIGADDLTFVFEELCGDGEIVAQYMGVTPFGFTGLMMRENATASSKYVWLFNRANNQTSWAIRNTTGGAPKYQLKPHLSRSWMKLNRTGNVFRGYLSTNGITWQLIFQSALTLNDCLLVGIATHSNVDGNTVTSMFKNVNISNDDLRPADSNYDQYTFNIETRSSESIGVEVYPNPVTGILNVRFNKRVDLSENTLAQIVDLNGRLVMQQTFERENDELMSFDVSSLNSGIYLLKLSTGSKTEIIKVVKH